MKILVMHCGVNREIRGDLDLCGSREDLRSLATQINNRLEEHPDMTYGWIHLRSTAGNCTPIPWGKPA